MDQLLLLASQSAPASVADPATVWGVVVSLVGVVGLLAKAITEAVKGNKKEVAAKEADSGEHEALSKRMDGLDEKLDANAVALSEHKEDLGKMDTRTQVMANDIKWMRSNQEAKDAAE